MESSTADLELPSIAHDEPFVDIVKKLSIYVVQAITQPSTFDQLRTTAHGNDIRSLVDHLASNVTNPAIVNALLTLKWHFSSLDPDDRGINSTRAAACEIVAWRFLTRLSERDAIDYCLYELPPVAGPASWSVSTNSAHGTRASTADERSTLLPHHHGHERPPTPSKIRRGQLIRSVKRPDIFGAHPDDDTDDPTSAFTGLNALEIAGVASAKKFLSQPLVQKIIYGMWTGEIMLWDSLSVDTVKKPQFYNKRTASPFSRLRVPKYIKLFEAAFFLTFLALYYGVLLQRDPQRITLLEALLYIWLAAFAYDELGEFLDAGLFYYADFWSPWDLAIILNGAAFVGVRVAGLASGSADMVDAAFDILSLEALFLVPRLFSLLSLHPYFGTLIPCLKEMARDFVKFMSVVLILYLGFLTTFTLLARDTFTVSQMSWILIKVFFGSSYIGFDVMHHISPLLGPPLMLLFITLTQILLITSLISILSSSFARVTAHARDEYLYVYSVFVLEAATSNRLTHFYPPLNLIPLLALRPLRLVLGAERMRKLRIAVLKVTHAPVVAVVWAVETLSEVVYGRRKGMFTFVAGAPREGLRGRRVAPEEGMGRVRRRGGGEGAERGTEALERKVEVLAERIAELAALIVGQQRGGAE